MSELNRENIIKALEWCIQSVSCEYCDYNKSSVDVCSIRSDALALIKELTEKVENYRNELGEVRVALAEANNDKKKLSEENESLKEDNHILATEFKDNIIADTVWKMHSLIKERCIKGGIYPAFVAGVIDQVAKEMLEG